MNPSIATRPATGEDDAFLYALFKTVRSNEFAYVPLPAEQLETLLRMQYSGQKHSYATQYPGGDRIILLDGEPVGRMWLYRGPSEHTLVDIALLPEFRNRGIGGALVSEAIEGARAAGVRLCCSVAATNHGSLAFHQRLGFQIVGHDELFYDLAT